jgi:hypothetical protein
VTKLRSGGSALPKKTAPPSPPTKPDELSILDKLLRYAMPPAEAATNEDNEESE